MGGQSLKQSTHLLCNRSCGSYTSDHRAGWEDPQACCMAQPDSFPSTRAAVGPGSQMVPATTHSHAWKIPKHHPGGPGKPCGGKEQGVTCPAAHSWGQSIMKSREDKTMTDKICKNPNLESQHLKVPKKAESPSHCCEGCLGLPCQGDSCGQRP